MGDPLGAVPALEEAVAADPGFAAALERLSGAHQALGYHARALSAAERAAAALGPGRSRLALRVRARLALLHGVPSDAVTAYAELARRFPNDASALLDLAAAQAQAGDLARSIETLRRVAELDRGDPRVWLRLAQASILAGDSRKAVEDYLVRALALQTQLANELGRADVLNALGVACHELGDYSRALEHHAAAAELRRRLGDLRGLATSRRNRARVLLATARPAEAEPELAAAGALYSRIGDQAGQADVLTDMGALHEGRGDYASARRAYEEALRLRQNLGDARRLAQGYDDVGYVLFLQGEYDEARVYWREALDRRRQAGERGGVILSLQNLGFLHSVQGRWGEALKTFLETLGDSRQIGFRPGMAVSFGNLGLLHQYEGRYAAALESYAQARALMRDLGDGRGMAEYTLKEAGALIEVGDLGNARARLDEVEGWLRQSPNREQGAEHQVLLGEWALRRGDAAAARRAFALAVDRAGASQSRPALLRARLAQAVARVALGDPALPALTAAAREAEALGEALGRLRAAEALARAHMRARRLPEAERWATTALALAQRYNWVAGRHRIHAVLADVLAARGDAAGSLRHREEAERWRSMLKEGLPERLRAGFDGIPPAA